MKTLLTRSVHNVFNGTQCKALCCWPNESPLMPFYSCLNFSETFTYVILREQKKNRFHVAWKTDIFKLASTI